LALCEQRHERAYDYSTVIAYYVARWPQRGVRMVVALIPSSLPELVGAFARASLALIAQP
jgi:hypothetical protein